MGRGFDYASRYTLHLRECSPSDFKQRCVEKLVHLGDVARDAERHDEAITQYSAALSLDPTIPHVFMKRSKAYMAKGLWEDAIDDADRVSHFRLAQDRTPNDVGSLGDSDRSIVSMGL